MHAHIKNKIMETKNFKILKNLCIEWYLQNISSDMHDKLYDVKKIYNNKFSFPLLYLNISVDGHSGGYFFLFCWAETIMVWEEKKLLETKNSECFYITNIKDFINKIKEIFIKAGLKDKILEPENYKSSKELKKRCLNFYNKLKIDKKVHSLFEFKLISNRNLQILFYLNRDKDIWGERGYRLYIFFAINSEEEKEIKELISDYKKLCHYDFCYTIIRNFNDFIDLCYYPLEIIKK